MAFQPPRIPLRPAEPSRGTRTSVLSRGVQPPRSTPMPQQGSGSPTKGLPPQLSPTPLQGSGLPSPGLTAQPSPMPQQGSGSPTKGLPPQPQMSEYEAAKLQRNPGVTLDQLRTPTPVSPEAKVAEAAAAARNYMPKPSSFVSPEDKVAGATAAAGNYMQPLGGGMKKGGSVKGYKAGGRVTGYRGYGIAKKV